MVIDVIDIAHVATLEPKGDAPIARDPYRMMALPITPKRVESQAGKIQIR